MIKHLVLPMAGIGKRLRPLTLRRPKALVPLCGVPLLEYVLEETVGTSIEQVTFVASRRHERQFVKYIEGAEKRFPRLRFHVRIQEKPAGNGHAVLCAGDVVGKNPCVVRFTDDLFFGKGPSMTAALSALYDHYGASVLLLQKVPAARVFRYGVVATAKASRPPRGTVGNVCGVTNIIEKPARNDAPSNLTVVGGYALAPRVMENLRAVAETLPQLAADALPIAIPLKIELMRGGKLYGWEFRARRFDCGHLEGLGEAEKYLLQKD